MVNNNFSLVDYFVFALFLLSSALIGIFFAWRDRKKSSKEEFLTGGRSLDLFPVCMSLIASFLSSNTILGVPSEIYLFVSFPNIQG
jgi:sodium-coupled monocarboxylate transporter 8/12